MLKAFNAFQIVVMYAAYPFFLSWLFQTSFPGAGVASYAAMVGYMLYTVLMVVLTYSAIEGD